VTTHHQKGRRTVFCEVCARPWPCAGYVRELERITRREGRPGKAAFAALDHATRAGYPNALAYMLEMADKNRWLEEEIERLDRELERLHQKAEMAATSMRQANGEAAVLRQQNTRLAALAATQGEIPWD